MNTSSTTEKGVSIIEAIIAISMISVAFAALLSGAVFFLQGGLHASDQAQALFLLDEGAEAVRFLRDESYSVHIAPLIGTGVHYLEPDISQTWVTTTTNSPIFGKFTRTIIASEVYRKALDDTIVPSTSADMKSVDIGTTQFDITVTWASGEVHATTYVTDLYDN